MSNNTNFKFTPIAGKSPLYCGYVLDCDPSKPTDVDYGDGDFSSYQVDTHIYWTPGTYGGSARFTDPSGIINNEKFSVTVLSKSDSQIISEFYQTKVATIEGDQVGFSIGLGITDGEVSKIVWVWGDKTPDSIYPFPELPGAKNPWHLYDHADIFNGSVTVYRKDGTYDIQKFSVVAKENPANNNDIAFIIQSTQSTVTADTIVNFSINSLGSLAGVNITHALWNMGNQNTQNRIGPNARGIQYKYSKGVYKVMCNVCLSNGKCYQAVPYVVVVKES